MVINLLSNAIKFTDVSRRFSRRCLTSFARPLNAIKGFANLLPRREPNLSDRGKENVAKWTKHPTIFWR